MGLPCFDSITQVPDTLRRRAVLAASHGGTYVASVALKLGLGGLIVSDAGIGRERAGIAGLEVLDKHDVPAAAISAYSARIGDGWDCLDRGLISFANRAACRTGVREGMPASQALSLLTAAPSKPIETIPTSQDAFRRIPGAHGLDIVLADSSSLIGPDEHGAIVVTGSHGALLGGRAEMAIKAPVLAAVYNDAGIGIDNAGISRLSVLDARGIAAATVSAWSARIGDAQSSLDDGFISCVNASAIARGGELGISCREFVSRLIGARLGSGSNGTHQ